MTATIPAQTNHLAVYERRRGTLIDLTKQQLGIVDQLGLDQHQTEGETIGDQLRGVLTRLEHEHLRVLIIGRFSSGKSTFINALLGEALLPAGLPPTTAVLCEIMYADEQHKHGILFPRGSKEEAARPSEPIDIDQLRAKLKEKITIKKGEISPYERAEVHWPLELCRAGVHIVDTVGLEDAQQRDRVTFAEVPDADSIIYCVDSQSAFSAADRSVLERMHALDRRSIFFVVTHYDMIRKSARRGEKSEAETRASINRDLAPWTDKGENGIFYVDSLDALDGRVEDDPGKIAASGILPLETALGRFLAEEKGRAKLVGALRSLLRCNRTVGEKIADQMEMWRNTASKLAARLEAAEQPLSSLKSSLGMIMEIIDLNNATIAQLSSDLATAFMAKAPDQIRQWAADYEITADIGFFSTDEELRTAIQPLIDYVGDQLGKELAQWMVGTLSRAVGTRLKSTESQVREQEHVFLLEAQRIRRKIAGTEGRKALLPEETPVELPDLVVNLGRGPRDVEVSPAMRAAAGALVGGAAGWGAAALMAVAFPVGVVAAIVAAVLGALFGRETVKDAIKEEAAANLLAGLEKGKARFIADVGQVVASEVRKRRDAFEARLAGELSSIRGEVTAILQEKTKGEADAKRETNRLEKLDGANGEIENKLSELLFEAGLA